MSNLDIKKEVKDDNLEVDVYIEISKNSNIKYEFDHTKNALICDRVLHTPFKYSFNYGFIPQTLSLDSDPLDVVVLMEDELVPGCLIRCKFLGVLETIDDDGNDPKIIMCPSIKIDPTYASLLNITDVPKHTLDKLRYFFSHYKDLENKHVTIGNFLDKNEAIHIYKQSVELYKIENCHKDE
jgi:inorganic pyrophosphatase